MRISLGYPDAKAERELLEGHNRRALAKAISACLSLNELTQLQEKGATGAGFACAVGLFAARCGLYAQPCGSGLRFISARSLGLVAGSEGLALVAHERHYLTPDDIQAVLGAVIEHRLGVTSAFTVQLLASVPVLA